MVLALAACTTPEAVSTDALHLARASASGDLERVEQLVAEGADVNERSAGGYTALMAASRNGRTEVVRWLLAREADATAYNEGGASVYWHAHAGRHRDVQLLLLEAGADSTGMGLVRASPANPFGYLRRTARGRTLVDALATAAVMALVLMGGLTTMRVARGRHSVGAAVGAVVGGLACYAVYLLATAHWDAIRIDYLFLGVGAVAVVGLGLASLVLAIRRGPADTPA